MADKFFSQYGDCIICGCQVTDGSITAGLTSIDGIVAFDPAIEQVEVFPVYLVTSRRTFSARVCRENEVRRYNLWCDSLNFRMEHKKPAYRRETSIHLLRSFFWDLYVDYRENPQVHKLYNFTHKEQIIFNFSMLIAEYYKTAREVSFYADKAVHNAQVPDLDSDAGDGTFGAAVHRRFRHHRDEGPAP